MKAYPDLSRSKTIFHYGFKRRRVKKIERYGNEFMSVIELPAYRLIKPMQDKVKPLQTRFVDCKSIKSLIFRELSFIFLSVH